MTELLPAIYLDYTGQASYGSLMITTDLDNNLLSKVNIPNKDNNNKQIFHQLSYLNHIPSRFQYDTYVNALYNSLSSSQ